LTDAGADFLEIQFPFSDPSADGRVIENACMEALESGFRVSDGFRLVARIKAAASVPVFVMSYGSIVFARGVRTFAKEAADSGAEGLIIPDLVPGHDEGLYQACEEEGLKVVPVVPPTLCEGRLAEILAQNPAYLYAAIRVGITGDRTTINDEVLSFLSTLKDTGRWVFAGFGIQSRAQVRRLAGYADTLIVGSEIVRTISSARENGKSVYDAVREKVKSFLEDEETVEAEEAQ